MFLIAIVWCMTAAVASTSSPEEVLEEYINALRSKDSEKLSELTAPSDLLRFRSFFSYFDRRDDSALGEQLRKSYFGPEATMETVRELSDAEVYAAYLTATRQALLTFGGTGLEMGDYEILGHVSQNDVEHYVVLFHASVPLAGSDEPFAYSEPVILSLKKGIKNGVFLQIPDQVFMSAVAISERIDEG